MVSEPLNAMTAGRTEKKESDKNVLVMWNCPFAEENMGSFDCIDNLSLSERQQS